MDSGDGLFAQDHCEVQRSTRAGSSLCSRLRPARRWQFTRDTGSDEFSLCPGCGRPFSPQTPSQPATPPPQLSCLAPQRPFTSSMLVATHAVLHLSVCRAGSRCETLRCTHLSWAPSRVAPYADPNHVWLSKFIICTPLPLAWDAICGRMVNMAMRLHNRHGVAWPFTSRSCLALGEHSCAGAVSERTWPWESVFGWVAVKIPFARRLQLAGQEPCSV